MNENIAKTPRLFLKNETMQASLITRSRSQLFLFYLVRFYSLRLREQREMTIFFSSAQNALMEGCVSILTWIQIVKWKKDNEEICLELAGFRAIQGMVQRFVLYLRLPVASSNKCCPLFPNIANNYQICLQIESLILCSRQLRFSHTNSQKYYFSSKNASIALTVSSCCPWLKFKLDRQQAQNFWR